MHLLLSNLSQNKIISFQSLGDQSKILIQYATFLPRTESVECSGERNKKERCGIDKMALHFQRTLLFAFSKFIFCISVASLTSVHLPPSFPFPVLSPLRYTSHTSAGLSLVVSIVVSLRNTERVPVEGARSELAFSFICFYRGYAHKAREKHKRIKSHTLSL